jgi:hypothetical protein
MGAMLISATDARAALVAHYTFDETNGSLALNDSAGTAHGAVAGVSFIPSGAGAPGSNFGNAGVFSGATTSHISFGSGAHPASFDLGTGDFTIAGWLRTPLNDQNFDRPVFQSTAFQNGGWSLEIGRADRTRRGQVYFTVGGGSAATFGATQAFSNGRVDDDAWHWVAVAQFGGTISLYVDGVKQTDGGTMVAGTSTATAPATSEAFFGRFGSANHFAGQLDDWRIYDHALSGTLDGNNTLTGGELFETWQENVPEPTSMAILALGTVALSRRRRSDVIPRGAVATRGIAE